MSVPDDLFPESGEDPQVENPNGLQAFEVVGQYLEEDGWFPRRLEGKYIYTANYVGANGELRCYAIVRVDLEQFIFYAVAPIKVPEPVRIAAAEYLTRANYGMRIGNFELDFADGEVRYKSSVDFEGQPLTAGLIRNAIYPAVHVLDKYLSGLMRVAYGGATPSEAIHEIEGTKGDADEV